jgi:cyclopropane-fatty-acyl-phospholipid synthase
MEWYIRLAETGLIPDFLVRLGIRKYKNSRSRILPALESAYGPREVQRWYVSWGLFLMGCEETFGLGGGGEFIVSHYLFRRV